MGFNTDSARTAARVGVELHVLGVGRHEHFHEVLGFTIGFIAFDDHFIHVLGVKVADRALDQAAFFVDEARGLRLQREIAHAFPQTHEVVEVALDFGTRALGTCGAHDEAHALRHFHFAWPLPSGGGDHRRR